MFDYNRHTLLRHLRQQFQIDWQGHHGIAHWARVRANGLMLANHAGASGGDQSFCSIEQSNGAIDAPACSIAQRRCCRLWSHQTAGFVHGHANAVHLGMFELNATRMVYLHRDAIDFRKNINGLASLVEHGLGMNAFANAVFVFGNRRRDRIKILGWERNGFWLLQKRLEDARFIWPRKDSSVIELSVQQLHWLLDGIDLAAMRGHAAVAYQKAA